MTYIWNIFKTSADAPAAWQMWFQDPRTSVMEGITDLNADIQFFLIVILLLV
jgi:heme/copper-type cytochrome/quinol oxidase subunit 2